MNRLEKVQQFLAEYTEREIDSFDEHPQKAAELANQFNIHAANEHPTVQHAHIHGQQSTKSGTLEALHRYIFKGEGSITKALKDKIRNRISNIANQQTAGIPKATRTEPLSDEELSKLKSLIMQRRAIGFDPRSRQETISGTIRRSQEPKITIGEETIGRIGPTDIQQLNTLYKDYLSRSESTPEGAARTDADINRVRDLIHGRIKEKMMAAAEKQGAADIRASAEHGNPMDIQAQNDALHAAATMKRHQNQLARILQAHENLMSDATHNKFMTGYQMRALTALQSNLTNKQMANFKLGVDQAYHRGEAQEVF